MEITSRDVSFEISRAVEMHMREYIEMFPEAWEFDYEKEFRDGLTFGRVVLEEAVRIVAETKLFVDYARQLGITLAVDEMQMIGAHIEELMLQHGGREAFYQELRDDGIWDTVHLADILGNMTIVDNLFFELMTNPDEFARFEAYMPEAIECDAESRAEAILARVHAGEDFDMLMWFYGEDHGMEIYPDGYTFIRGDMVIEFEEAALALEVGQISGLVSSGVGYHIIMRAEPDPENVMQDSMFLWGDGTDELIGAKHILIAFSGNTLEDRMIEAILIGFEIMRDNSEIILLPALDNVPLDDFR